MTGFEMSMHNGLGILRRPGSGSPVVIVPGVMADAQSWLPVAEALVLPNPVAIVNRRGRAPSAGLGASYGLLQEISDLSGIISGMGAPVHLFGWSYGGLIALETATLGLPVASVSAYEPVSSPFVPEVVEKIQTALALGDVSSAVEMINIDVSGFSQDYVDALRQAPVWSELCRLALPLGQELAAIDCFKPSYGQYRTIDIPVRLLLGADNEGRQPYGGAFERFATALPMAAIKRLDGQGHLAHIAAPALLAQFIADFVRDVESASADCSVS